VRAVAVELGPLVLGDGVLDGQTVQLEFLGDRGDVVLVRFADVHPDDGRGFLEVVGDLLDGKVLGLEDPVPVRPGPGHDGIVAANPLDPHPG